MKTSQRLAFNSEFIPEIEISIVLSEHPQYEDLIPMFKEYGYGFMIPGKNIIVIDGEQLVKDNSSDLLKFIEAHEIAHIIIGHNGPRNSNDELEADLGAYILLSKKDKPNAIKLLLKNFKKRHGIKFDKRLIERVKKYFL